MSALAFGIAYIIRRAMLGPDIGPFSNYFVLGTVQAISTVLVFFFYKFYHRRYAALLLDEVYRLIGAITVASLITVAFITFALRDTLEFQRGHDAHGVGCFAGHHHGRAGHPQPDPPLRCSAAALARNAC